MAQLRALPRRFDLFLTHCDPANRALLERAVAGSGLNCRLILLFCPNRGRDIAPLLIDLGRTLLDYDLALHLHVKKTVERETLGTQWLNDNLEKLLRDGRYVATLLDYFAFDQSCGILYPVPFEPIIPHMGWGPNRTMACAIMTRCGLDAALLPAQEPIFAAGSMFWFRPAALRPLFEANLRYDEFPSEPIAEDGTLAHAFERVFLYVAEGGGYGCRAIYPSNRQPLTADRPVDISVIIALGQEAATLERAIQSVLGQHDPQLAIEILLVESGGAGRNDRLAAFYQCHFPLLRHLQPICAALQLRPSEVIGACQGRYVAFLGAGAMLTLDSLPAMFQQGEASGALIIEGLRAEPRPIAPDETSILPYLPALPDQPYGKLFRCSFFLEQLDEGTDWPQLRFSASDQVTIARLCYVVD